jgi:hypothetical protein
MIFIRLGPVGIGYERLTRHAPITARTRSSEVHELAVRLHHFLAFDREEWRFFNLVHENVPAKFRAYFLRFRTLMSKLTTPF